MKAAGLRLLVAVTVGVLLAACGTGSGLPRSAAFSDDDLRGCQLLALGEFPGQPARPIPAAQGAAYDAAETAAAQRFAPLLVRDMRIHRARGEFVRDRAQSAALLLDNGVSDFDAGNAALRGAAGPVAG